MQTAIATNILPVHAINAIPEEETMETAKIIDKKRAKATKKTRLEDLQNRGYKFIGETFVAVVGVEIFTAQLLEMPWGNDFQEGLALESVDGLSIRLDREWYWPIFERFKGISDPVVALWNEFQAAIQEARAMGEAEEEKYEKMSPEEQKAHDEANPEKMDGMYCSKAHKKAYDRADAIEKMFYSTPAQSPEGIMLQVEYASSDPWTDIVLDPLKRAINAGLVNLRPITSPVPVNSDPVVALLAEYHKADEAHTAAFYSEAAVEEDEKAALEILNAAEERLCSSIAKTPEGIAAQMQYIRDCAKRDTLSDSDEIFNSIEAGLKNLQSKAA